MQVLLVCFQECKSDRPNAGVKSLLTLRSLYHLLQRLLLKPSLTHTDSLVACSDLHFSFVFFFFFF